MTFGDVLKNNENLCSVPFTDPSREQARSWVGQELAPFEADPICPTLKDREGPQDGFPAGRDKSDSFLSQGSHICKELERMCPHALWISLYFFRIRKRPQTALTGVLSSHHSRRLLSCPSSSSCLGGKPQPLFLTAFSWLLVPPEPPDQLSAPSQPTTCTQQ